MTLHVKRSAASPNETCGALYINGAYYAPTIEPSASAAHPCIAAGDYSVVITYSPRFRKPLPLLVGVQGRSGIRIHGGTRAEHTQGCICIPLAKMPQLITIINSALTNNEKVYIRITDPCPCGE